MLNVPRPEVYRMQGWGEREEMNLIVFLVRRRQNIDQYRPPRDLSVMNKAWFDFFGLMKPRLFGLKNSARSQFLSRRARSKIST
jgi:hypothetical protein